MKRFFKVLSLITILSITLLSCSKQESNEIIKNEMGEKTAMENFKVAKPPVDEITFTPVIFENKDSKFKLAGTIYAPKDMKDTDKLPAIVLQGPMGATKEQCQSLYAQILASKGYITMVYDYSYIGSSQGLPRGYEDPDVKASDIKSAISFISTYSNVDKNRIGAVGICGSGVYLPYAALKEPTLKAIACVNPFTIIDTVPFDEKQVLEDKAKYEKEGTVTRMPDMIEPGSEGAEYYFNFNRGAVTNRVTFITWSQITWSKFHPNELAKGLTLPLLVIVGENAFTRQGAEIMYQNAASKDKKLVQIKGARHFDMYDGAEYALPAIDAILEFFKDRI